ncbi:SMP-30/gluconolactonase/LRE family protein [Sandaracinobacteroides saxicola]|uniref:Uncharacterized protein n=1 Tax=Sandaracinobacteroides saxicola TaxID=2759707 RepID=A0A7G5IHN8_9SPHN|nr:hypothetical protein [Sandaracinobacteroides saxicola]QMW22880.1 hypothetical protein H3309_16555 [Sandaracinobacteroides saxicola]
MTLLPFAPGDVFVPATVLEPEARYPTGMGRILQLAADGSARASVDTGRRGLISGLGLGPDGVLWVLDAQARGLDRFAPDGRRLPTPHAMTDMPFGSVLFPADGTILLAEHLCGATGPFAGGGRVYRFDADGRPLAVYATETNGGVSGFLGVTHMALSADGQTLFHVSETGSHIYAHDLIADRRLGAIHTREDPPGFLFGLAALPCGGIVVATGGGARRLSTHGEVSELPLPPGRGWANLVVRAAGFGGGLWACDFFAGRLVALDLSTGAVLADRALGLEKALTSVAEVPA